MVCSFFGVLNRENMLSFPLGKAVKGDFKGLFEQQGQSLGKGVVFGDDPHLPAGKGVAVQQHPVGLRLGAALAVQLPPAQLVFLPRLQRVMVFTPR